MERAGLEAKRFLKAVDAVKNEIKNVLIFTAVVFFQDPKKLVRLEERAWI